jgi:hypothetical protein
LGEPTSAQIPLPLAPNSTSPIIHTLPDVPQLPLTGTPIPTAPVAPPAPAGTLVSPPPSHDSAGIPWDGRIHSTPGKLTATGTWRARRGVDAAIVTAVTAELHAQGKTVAPTPVAPPAAVPVAPVAPPADWGVPVLPSVPPVPVMDTAAAAPVAPPAAIVPPPPTTVPQVPAAPPAISFREFMEKMAKYEADGKINMAHVQYACQMHGVPQPMVLATNPAQIPAVLATVTKFVESGQWA